MNTNQVRSDILEEAEDCVCGQREEDYGSPENNFKTIGKLWGAYLLAAHPYLSKALKEVDISPHDVALMMSLLKVARAASGRKKDNYVDLAGYAACAAEMAYLEQSQEET